MTHRHIMDDDWLVEDLREKFAEEFGELDPPDPNKMWVDPTHNESPWTCSTGIPGIFYFIDDERKEMREYKEEQRAEREKRQLRRESQAWMRKPVKAAIR